MPPLVSIITPAYRAEKFLPRALESVSAQALTDWEHIISVDPGEDRTLEIALDASARDPRIKVIENPPLRHPGPVRNAALKIATGKYIAFLDVDDEWLPRKLETQLAALASAQRPGVCCGYSVDIAEGPEITERQSRKSPPPTSHADQYRDVLLSSRQPRVSTWLLERSFADEVGPFTDDPLLPGTEDWDYLIRAVHQRPLLFIPEPLIRYRIHGSSITERVRSDWERRFQICRLVEHRGEMPLGIGSKMWSAAWWLRAEIELEHNQPGWRSSFLKSFRLDPSNIRRWPALLTLLLNRNAMCSIYRRLRAKKQDLAKISSRASEL